MGIDNSVSGDPLVIAANANLGTNNILSMDSGGNLTLPAYSTGLLHSDSSGVITSSAVALGGTDVSGTLPLTRGGTNKSLTASAGGIPYFDADSFEVLSAGTSGKPLVSGGTGAPSFSTLGISGGGTNNASLDVTAGSVIWTDGTKLEKTGVGANNSVLVSGGSIVSWASYLGIASGGTNNPSLGVTAGGFYYGDGSKIIQMGAGSSGQVIQSAGGGTPTWMTPGGTWTPTLTNGTNTAASTARQGNWARGKDTVCGSFTPDWDPTSTGTTVLGVSLPVASNFTSDLVDAAGGCTWNGGTTNGVCTVNGDSTNDRLTVTMQAATTANATGWIWFCYTVK